MALLARVGRDAARVQGEAERLILSVIVERGRVVVARDRRHDRVPGIPAAADPAIAGATRRGCATAQNGGRSVPRCHPGSAAYALSALRISSASIRIAISISASTEVNTPPNFGENSQSQHVNRLCRSHDWLWNTGSIPICCSKWRRAYQAGLYEPPTLLPVNVVPEERAIENAASLPVQPQSMAQPAVAGVIEICVGVARVRIEGTPDAATLRVVLHTLRAAAEAET